MKKTVGMMIQLPVVLAILLFLGLQNAAAYEAGTILAKVDVTSSVAQLGLPVHAHLQGASGQDYALVVANQNQLDASGMNYKILEVIPANLEGTNYIIALERISGARTNAAGQFNVLFDDGRYVIVRVSEFGAEQLVLMGFEIEWLSETPIVLMQSQTMSLMAESTLAVDFNAVVQEMINAVTQTKIYDYTANISGESSVVIGGSPYTISSRHTNSGTSISKATQYMYEFSQGLGLSVSYHNWTYGFYSGRNVVAEKSGTVSPGEIVLVTAHLDSMPSGSNSPGADDNGSGSVGVMMAAEMFADRSFERTTRFVWFTGEEQGLYGSKRYADKVVADGDNIVAVYNMDMIAWDDVGGPTLRIHTRTSSSSGYASDMVLANTFVDVVNTYGMSSALTPIIDSDGITASDHSSFWNKGFPAILAIEDDVDDFCDYYHTVNDTLSTLNMTYYTNYVKASVGTAAHLAKVVGGAVLNASFTHTSNLLEATFTDTSTAPTGENITAWSWNFGDGNTSTLQNPVHTYATAGSYNVSLAVTDSTGGTDSISKNVTVTDTVVEYCASQGNNVNYEWIDGVTIGTFSNPSGAAGYSDFTSKVVNMTAGQSYATTLSPGFASSSYTEYWKVWIDFNRDGDFADSGEEVFSATGRSDVNGSIAIPGSATTGTTRMRVTMKYNGVPGSCGSFTYGEVEDYTVDIGN
ncbi:MAG: M28 family peptidase [Proteobacteria bacterium]|nr:M28 family peptidase [Pseudomonadota bacterium]